MKKILIVFATREGQTAKIAQRLSDNLVEAGAAVALINANDTSSLKNIELNSFELLVFGASMHAGGLEAEIVDFINRNADQISGMARSFFLVSLSAATKDPALRQSWLADARRKVDEQLEVRFDDCEMIAGALAYSKYSKPVKWLMKRIVKKAGEATDTSKDYEYTDWRQVELYAQRLFGD